MKTLFLSINSQFVHTLLAPRYLAQNSTKHFVEIFETNVNVQMSDLLAQIYCKKPDVLAISCYVFNIKFVRTLLIEIRNILPNLIIIAGGYEASFDSERYEQFCDYIIKGEGEFAFAKLLDDIASGNNIPNKIIQAGTIKNLDSIISPYTEEYSLLGKQKILYFETSRGCPFQCSYCMSANTNGVRVFSLQRIFSDFEKIMQYSPKQVKLVDRTFNYDIKRCNKIFEFLIDNYGSTSTNFHFEMAPELFDDQMFKILEKCPKGLFQFEIGVQSFNSKTLDAVNRKSNFEKLEYNIKKLVSLKNIHIHVDLIAGLPYENYDSFVEGFNRLFSLKPHCLQLGFLKILKGSLIYNNRNEYVTFSSPPYEIVSSPVLDFSDILKLKIAEEMLDWYYNSGKFALTMDFLLPKFYSPYKFFYELGCFFRENNIEKRNLSALNQCNMLFDFLNEKFPLDLDSDNLKIFLEQCEILINMDFKNNGNAREWRRHLKHN